MRNEVAALPPLLPFPIASPADAGPVMTVQVIAATAQCAACTEIL
jgi:hypothetical protein